MSDPRGISEYVRVGLALSGGGARGLAQVGAIKALERAGIPIHLVAGTSIGAIVGGIYACTVDATETERRVLATLGSPHMEALKLERLLKIAGIAPVGDEAAPRERVGLLARGQRLVRRVLASHAALTRQAVLEPDVVIAMFEHLFEGQTFDEAKIPFAAIAADLEQGCEVIVASGSLARGVAASSAIAGIFPPVEVRGRKLIDGGYTSPVPVDAARVLGANVVIGVDVSLSGLDRGKLGNAVEVAMRSAEITLLALEREQRRRADVVIPARGQPRHWSDYSHPEEAVRAGEVAADRMIDSIRDVIEERSRLFL